MWVYGDSPGKKRVLNFVDNGENNIRRHLSYSRNRRTSANPGWSSRRFLVSLRRYGAKQERPVKFREVITPKVIKIILDEPAKRTETLGGGKENVSKRLNEENNYSVVTPRKRNYPALSSCNPVVFSVNLPKRTYLSNVTRWMNTARVT